MTITLKESIINVCFLQHVSLSFLALRIIFFANISHGIIFFFHLILFVFSLPTPSPNDMKSASPGTQILISVPSLLIQSRWWGKGYYATPRGEMCQEKKKKKSVLNKSCFSSFPIFVVFMNWGGGEWKMLFDLRTFPYIFLFVT